MLPIAAAEAEAGKQSGSPDLIFFTAKSEQGIPSQVRHVCNLKRTTDAPQVGIGSLIFVVVLFICFVPQRSFRQAVAPFSDIFRSLIVSFLYS